MKILLFLLMAFLSSCQSYKNHVRRTGSYLIIQIEKTRPKVDPAIEDVIARSWIKSDWKRFTESDHTLLLSIERQSGCKITAIVGPGKVVNDGQNVAIFGGVRHWGKCYVWVRFTYGGGILYGMVEEPGGWRIAIREVRFDD
ncbi:hypothetical protein [Prosthecobacter sp.]|uniref:hypothetical protein n=1 Tax=Prosthecobacter sp. TaxID=1965333 RepID=UPI0037836EFD